ncbi:MAG TPA: hypothetical protein VGI73_13795 [Solirubrobacterales bacterium]
MNCVCGCGRRLSGGRRQVELNLLAGEVAIELVVWDRVRALRSPLAAEEVSELLEDGAPHYQRLLAAIHTGEVPGDAEQAAEQEWIARSKAARQRLGGQLPVPKKKVKLSADEQERIDRAHPELTFTGGGLPAVQPVSLRGGAFAAAPDPELEALIAAADGEEYEPLAVAWLARLLGERQLSLDELRWLLGRLEDVRSGRVEEAEPALRRFLAERS